MKYVIITEGGLSRIWQHTKDGSTFAIIGSDKQLADGRHIDCSKELLDKTIENKMKHRINGYNYIRGSYTYDNGEVTYKNSIIIYNIEKEDALRIANEIGQKAITWKDKDFFGIIKVPNGEVEIEFENNENNLKFNNKVIADVGGSSALVGKNWKKNPRNNGKPFVFEAYLVQPTKKVPRTCDLYLLCRERVLENGDIDEAYFYNKNGYTIIEALKILNDADN